MVGRKAYIRTLEAIIAIVLLLFATYTLTPKPVTNPEETPYVIESAQDYVVKQVTQDPTLRQQILDSGTNFAAANNSLTGTVKKRLPAGYDFSIAICDNPSCVTLPGLAASVYMDDAVVAGKTTAGEPVIKLVRVWFWRVG